MFFSVISSYWSEAMVSPIKICSCNLLKTSKSAPCEKSPLCLVENRIPSTVRSARCDRKGASKDQEKGNFALRAFLLRCIQKKKIKQTDTESDKCF